MRQQARTSAPHGWVRVESLHAQRILWTGPSGKRYQFEAGTVAAVDENDLTALLATGAFKAVT